MRILGKIESQEQARNFSYFLKKEKIENTCESIFNKESNTLEHVIWIHDEDDQDKAQEYFKEFLQDPNNEKYCPPLQKEPLYAILNPKSGIMASRRKFAWLTYFILFLCGFVYLLNLLQEMEAKNKDPNLKIVFVTPIQAALMYDLPVALIRLEKVFKEYAIDPSEKLDTLSPAAKQALMQAQQAPTFRGFYPVLLHQLSKNISPSATGPLFEKIREGEIWRLFTPCILHKDLLHILFNMLWLVVLGKQIEERIKRYKLILFCLIAGIVSNTVQYFMSGPYFLGFSGVIMAMAGFIWMRKRCAPWEGYPLHSSTFVFLGFFVVAMVFLQIITMFFQLFGSNAFMFNIANSAHISGALIGALMGKMPFFQWRGS